MQDEYQYDIKSIGDAAITAALEEMKRVYDNVHGGNQSFGANDGFTTDFFAPMTYRSYDWGEAEDLEKTMAPNLEFAGVRVWWYKYAGSGTKSNREMTPQDWSTWLETCLEHVRSLDSKT